MAIVKATHKCNNLPLNLLYETLVLLYNAASYF